MENAQNTKIIECFGLPGAGKSTIVNALLDNKQSALFVVPPFHKKSVLFKLSFLLKTTLAELPFLIRATYWLCRMKCCQPKQIKRLLESTLSVRYTLCFKQDKTPIIFDQWILQNIWSIFVSGGKPRTRYIHKILQHLYKDIDLKVLLFKGDISLAQKRILERTHGKSRFDGLTDEETYNKLKKNEENFKEITASLENLGFDIINLDIQNSIENNVEYAKANI
ncbi:MAG: hypothetical protein ACTSXQ_03095 [Alphaproteobacteria bacterium]